MTEGVVEWLIQADRHVANQKWLDAATAYEQALKLDRANIYACNQLGIVYEELDQPDKAEYSYQSALELDPNLPIVRYNLGMLYKSQGRIEQAQREMEKFLRLSADPTDQAEAKEILAELSGFSFEKCAKCAYISIIGDAFKKTRHGLVCPRCSSEIQMGRTIKGYLAIISLFLSSAAIMYSISFLILGNFLSSASEVEAPQEILTLPYLATNFLLLWIFVNLLIIPHELSHAIGTWLVRGRVFEIRVGIGPNIFERILGNLTISWHKYPMMGACIVAFSSLEQLKFRFLVSIGAGLLFHGIVLVPLLPGFKLSNIDSSLAWREVFVLANVWLLVLNLIPRQINLGDLSLNSDGLQLIRTVSEKFKDKTLHAAYFLLESLYSFKNNNYKQAIRWCKAGLRLYPDDPFLKTNLGIALLELENYTEALTLFETLLTEDQRHFKETGSLESQIPFFKAMSLNNAAYTTLLTNYNSDDLKRARLYSEEAFRMTPWNPSIEGTWGAVLVETGAIKEGLEHLLQACKYDSTPRSKALNLAQAAIGNWRIGNNDRALELLKEAIALDSECVMVRKAKAAIAMA